MKKELSPAVIGGVIVAILAVAGFFFWKMADPAGSLEGQKPPGMPADAQAEFAKRMGGAPGGGMPTGPGGAAAPGGTAGAPAAPMRMTGPPQ